MTVNDTMLGRMKKLLRDKFKVATGQVTEDTSLGKTPIGFDTSFIKSEFCKQVDDWFKDLITPFPSVGWDEGTTIGDLIKEILARSTVQGIKTEAGYRKHAHGLAETAFENAAGAGAQTVPVADGPRVQESLNGELHSSVMRNVSLNDLAGDRATILANLLDRMLI